MKLRIAISGPSGVGKSTLAQELSRVYNIPFITTSTKPLWDRHNIKTHQELIQRTLIDPQWGLNFQDEVLEYRIDQLIGVSEFVTDRAPLDNLAYYLMQNSASSTQEQTSKYIQKCKDTIGMFTGLIVIPFTDEVVLEDDGKRIANRYYQEYTNSVFILASKIMAQEFSQIHGETLMMWDFTKRMAQATHLLNKIIAYEKTDSLSNIRPSH